MQEAQPFQERVAQKRQPQTVESADPLDGQTADLEGFGLNCLNLQP